ncbi:MAG: alpha-mannosidase [Candidatus Dormibacteraeota bacterium]|nr:alpha-mannosidase [Candidatus Dormibacteraeota bacterium]
MLTAAQRVQRLQERRAELELWLDRAWLPLPGWRFEGAPIEVTGPWARRDGLVNLELAEAEAPSDWPLEETVLELMPGGEGLLRLDYGSISEAFGLDPWHTWFPLRRRRFAARVEAVARRPFGIPAADPRLEQARLVWIERSLLVLLRRLRLVIAAAAALDDDAVGPLLAAAERALTLLEWPSGSEGYLGRAARDPRLVNLWSPPSPAGVPEPLPDSSRRSVELAAGQLSRDLVGLRSRYPPRGRLALAGHAHIDLAWLWPLAETALKTQRSFHTAAGLLDRYPEMTFVHSSAEAYELAREVDPELLGRVRDQVAGGRWEPVGGMWVEPDMNMTGGESIVRQLLHGQRWFEREFGRRHSVGWLPDCFGFTPALPQLLRGAGMEGFFTTKLNWSETNRFPYDLFWWEGLDGTRILSHTFRNERAHDALGLGAYNGDTDPASLLGVWQGYGGRHLHPESLYTVGYGDGGGGPTAEMVEDVRELASFPSLPEVSFTRVDALFERLCRSAEAGPLPVWSGELYLELHRGTLTTQGRVKRLHRQAERDLVAAEVVSSLGRLLGTGTSPPQLGRAWRLLLRNQFHDILPGSSIGEVYRQAEAELAESSGTARAAAEAGLRALAGAVIPAGERPAVLVVNPDLSSRPLRVAVPEPLPGAQAVEGGWVLGGGDGVAGLEAAVLLSGVGQPGVAADGLRLENDLLRAELAEDGTLRALYDKRAGREALSGPGNQLWAYADHPRGWDAWDIDAGYSSQGEPLPAPHTIEVVERGPHRAAIRLHRRFRSSGVVQTVRLWSGSPRLEFVTELDWHERRVLLKARFPLGVRSSRATFETAFGVVERPTHRNTSWDAAQFEVAGHRFADLSEPGYGVALLNDGRYGHHALGNELGLSLLRSPHYPDPMADEGRHQFIYALLPHAGGWLEGGVLAEAEDLNRPLLVVGCRAGRESRVRSLAVEGVRLGLGALKAPEDGDEGALVLRLYEPQGARGRAGLRLPEGWRLAAALNLLEDRIGEPDLDFLPFQVRTYLLTKQ